MVVWEGGGMKKSDYRKFIVKTVSQNDDFASMREVVGSRYKRLQEEKKNTAGTGSYRWRNRPTPRGRRGFREPGNH